MKRIHLHFVLTVQVSIFYLGPLSLWGSSITPNISSFNPKSCYSIYSPKKDLTKFNSYFTVPNFTGPNFTTLYQITNSALANQIRQTLFSTKNYIQQIEKLNSSLKEYEKYLFFIRPSFGTYNGKKYFDFYRNPDFLSDVEYKVSNHTHLFKNQFVYGYHKSHHDMMEKQLGRILDIELTPAGQIKSLTFSSEKQRDHFKKHFLGVEFTKRRKDRILKINTEIFNQLRNIPAANEKVIEFEKSRGWPAGTAEKLGLVYYSRELFDIKTWAREKWLREKTPISYNDLVDAGWLNVEFRNDGRAVYRENYDDSIKIPLYDLNSSSQSQKSQIASWRTRNLKSRPNLPKYLSWPKDRSLIEVEPLIEEFYNSWQLEKAKGQKLVITEGEFKCAIGQMYTGILHLGLPGISQFNTSIKNKILAASPSEVIVLFDRDPKGKALFRIDLVTDSERASYLIAKELEAAGIKVKVAYLPDVNSGGKVGIDDLILEKGADAYLKSLDQAVSPDEFAQIKNMDTTLTELSSRKNKINKSIQTYEQALDSTLGFSNLSDHEVLNELKKQLALLERTLEKYMNSSYPGRKGILHINPKFSFILQKRNSNNAALDKVLILDKKIIDPELSSIEFSNYLKFIFPSDDYTFVENVSSENQNYPLLIVKKDNSTAVALVKF